MLIHGKLRALSIKQADKVCLIHGKLHLTYQQFTQQVDELAYRLAVDIKKGDKVLVKLLDPLVQLLYLFGVLQVGGACVFIDPSTSEEVCTELLKLHNIKLSIDENFQPSTEAALELPEIHPENIFLGALSSGSTGTPKLIWRDHQSWTRGFPVQGQVFNLAGSDTLYLVGSLVYTANLNACLHLLYEGGTVVFASNSLPRTWVREIRNYDVSGTFMVPTHYKMLLKAIKTPISQIKSIVTAGEKIDLSTVQNLMTCFPHAEIYEYYGASELGHVSYSTAGDLLQHPEAVGKAFPGVTVSIDDHCIWVESPYLAPHYRPKATVGDLGRMDTEGYLYLLGRKHGIINTGGIKVIPEQVEAVLLQCPGITVAIVGGRADPLRGQRVYAWVVRNKASLMAEEIIAFCRTKIRQPYCPHKIIFVDEMPMTNSGKINRSKLKSEEGDV